MAITSFNKSNNAILAADINAALQEVARKHNVTIPAVDLRYCRDGTYARLYKMDIYPAHIAAAVAESKAVMQAVGVQQAESALIRAMQRDGIVAQQNAKGDRLTGYKGGNKYCYGYTSARGTEWWTTVAGAQKRFGYRAPAQVGSQQQPSA